MKVATITTTSVSITTSNAAILNNGSAPWTITDSVTYNTMEDCLGASRMTIGTAILAIGSLYAMI